MRDVLYLEQIEQAEALLKPQRVEVLRQLAEPRTCTEVAARLEPDPAAGLLPRQAAGRRPAWSSRSPSARCAASSEGIYQATARSYWLSPRLVGRIGAAPGPATS